MPELLWGSNKKLGATQDLGKMIMMVPQEHPAVMVTELGGGHGKLTMGEREGEDQQGCLEPCWNMTLVQSQHCPGNGGRGPFLQK